MKVNIYTLGCKVNFYESNLMKEKLIDAGYTYTDMDDSDIVIINTCSVTNTADNKSLKAARHAAGLGKNVIVVGCSSQNKEEAYEKIDGVNVILGNKGKSDIVSYIQKYFDKNERIIGVSDIQKVPFEEMKVNNFDKTRAFVKIQDGCNNYCSYCIIPYLRGDVRSKKSDDVINEVKSLIESGHKEIVLTGIHTGHYGSDINESFAGLLKKLVKIDGLLRLRISSVEITELNDEFLDVLKNSQVLVDHIHIPLQSGSNTVLKRMNRKYDKDYFINKIDTIRSIRPDISITTDLIVGFPGETEEDFQETLDVVRKVRYDSAFTFIYSKRSGTPAAVMENQVSEEVVKNRFDRLLREVQEISAEEAGRLTGTVQEVLVEGMNDHDPSLVTGRMKNNLLVHFPGDQTMIGTLQNVFLDTCKGFYYMGTESK
mgnify:CR=1 FL=1